MHVVCDRYIDSSVAYQGIARGLGEAARARPEPDRHGGLLPERTFVLLVDPAAALARSSARLDRIERAADGFMERVDAAYRALARAEPGRIVALDGARSAEELHEEIREHVRAVL
jgi:dTMP kinase